MLGIDADEEILGIINNERVAGTGPQDQEKFNELELLVGAQRQNIETLHKLNSTLSEDKLLLKRKMEQKLQQNKEKVEDFTKRTKDREKALESKVTQFKKDLDSKDTDILKIETKLSELKSSKDSETLKLHEQLCSLQKALVSNKTARTYYELEQKMAALTSERHNQFSHINNLEISLNENEEFLSQKNTQVQMLKDQMRLLMKEIDILKKTQCQNAFISLMPGNVVKPIRGGGNKKRQNENFLPKSNAFTPTNNVSLGSIAINRGNGFIGGNLGRSVSNNARGRIVPVGGGLGDVEKINNAGK